MPRGSGYPKDPIVDRRTRPNLDEREVFTPHGLRCARPYLIVTELARAAAADEATISDLRIFKRVIRAAAKDDRRLVKRWRRLLESRPFPGGAILEDELFNDFERTLDVRSDGEVDLVDLCREYGLPIPFTNVKVHGFEVDGWYPDHGVFAEVDTYETHGDRVSFERDHKRLTALAAHGIRSFPVTTIRMRSEPAAVAAELEATLAHALEARRQRGDCG